jgi:flavin reductase (DIM6/NTAB) family NADH-FMN oxidoreductase RutF
MEKISIDPANKFCPQTVFMYGTKKEDGAPNFGTFTWLSYCWDGEMSVIASIGGGKLTIDRIRATKMFSANLVTESLLQLADYAGNNPGYIPGKMDIPVEIENGAVLDVPILKDSPWVFELEAKQSIPLDGNEVFICKIHNVLAARELLDGSISADERMKSAAPVIWIGEGSYFPVKPIAIGKSGDWKDTFKKVK